MARFRNKEIMRFTEDELEKTIEYNSCLKLDEELNKWKEEVAKSNKELWTIIGSLQNYYLGTPTFDELSLLSEQVEKAMDDYASLESYILDVVDSFDQSTQEKSLNVPQEAFIEKRKSDTTLDDIWATNKESAIEILLPRINELQHTHLLSNFQSSEDIRKKIREQHRIVNEDFNDRIDALIKQYKKTENKKWWQFWRRG